MSNTSRLVRRSVAALAVVTATAVTGCAATPEADAAAPAGESCDEPRDDAAVLPAGLEDGSRLFVTTYRSYIVQLTCGRLELIEPTGFDSCYFLDDDVVRGYPC
jgi:hypothetical protein